jgi:hypothetical protein
MDSFQLEVGTCFERSYVIKTVIAIISADIMNRKLLEMKRKLIQLRSKTRMEIEGKTEMYTCL